MAGTIKSLSKDGRDITLVMGKEGLALAAGLLEPGIYRAQPSDQPYLAVNVNSQAADTRSLDEAALASWMSALGSWQWIDEDDPAAALVSQSPVIRLGWMLLWVVLTLVLIETGLARWFSHAATLPTISR